MIPLRVHSKNAKLYYKKDHLFEVLEIPFGDIRPTSVTLHYLAGVPTVTFKVGKQIAFRFAVNEALFDMPLVALHVSYVDINTWQFDSQGGIPVSHFESRGFSADVSLPPPGMAASSPSVLTERQVQDPSIPDTGAASATSNMQQSQATVGVTPTAGSTTTAAPATQNIAG